MFALLSTISWNTNHSVSSLIRIRHDVGLVSKPHSVSPSIPSASMTLLPVLPHTRSALASPSRGDLITA